MSRFRETLRRCRLVVLTVLFVAAFYGVEGHLFSQVYAMARQDEARLKEMSERLGIPVERLRRDNPSLVEAVMNLVSDPDDRFRARQLERLEAVIERSQAEVDANPYRERIAAVKSEHRRDKVEGLLRDLAELSSLRVLGLRPPARRALLRNLKSALREELALPPLPAGLPAQTEARHREMEDRLRRLAGDLEPLLSAPEALSEARLSRTVADVAGAVNGAVSRPRQDAPRFRETPLPVQRVERQAATAPASRTGSVAPTPAATSSAPAAAAGRPRTTGAAAAGAPTLFGPIATEITALAGELGNSPARIFTWVHDNVAYDPKWGQVRSPLGTLLERTGTSWDQAVLLAELLTAAGVDARLEWGEVEIPRELLLEITGTANANDAGGVLATGGVPIVLQQIASQVVTAKISHVWVKAHVDYIPNRGVTPGPADTWIRMDPSLKRSSYQPGIAVHQSVPYGLGDYLQSATPLAPRRFREESLWAYIRANDIECTTLEQLKKAGSIVQEGFPYIPGTLRGKILSVAGEATAVPEPFRHRLRVEVKESGGPALLAWEQPWAEIWGARTEIAWVGATPADEATIASFGSVFDTPPYLVDLAPTVRVGGVEVARGSALGAARDTEVWVTLLETSGEATTLTHDTLAGEHHVLALDFGRLPQRLIDDHQVALAAALAAGDDFEAEAETLYLLGAQYMHNLGRDLDDLAGWNWQRLVKLGTEGLISQTGIVTTTVAGTPFGFRRGERNVDVARMILGIFPADGDHQYKTATFELLGSQSSYLEGEVFNQVVQQEGIASVSALTRSKREGQALTRVDSANVGTVLAQVNLDPDVEQEIEFAVSQGKIAWVAEDEIAVNQWTGTGYVLEDPTTGAAGYLISGSLAGGSSTGEVLGQLSDLLGSEPWLEGLFGELIAAVLGLVGSSGSGGSGQGGGSGTNKGDPINLASGNMWQQELDLSINTRGLPVVWSRTYNSRSTYNGPLGYGWTFTYGEHLEPQPDGSVLYREHDGTEHIFASDGGSGYERPPGKHLTLVQDPSGFTLRTKNGVVLSFDTAGRLLSIVDANGNSTTLGYGAGGELETVSDAAGRVVLTVTTTAGKIAEIADVAGRSVSYTHTGDDLTTVTDAVGQPWVYGYDAAHNLLSRTDPLGNADTFSYDALDRCVRHTDAIGGDDSFAYTSIGRAAVQTDQRGFDTYVEFDDRGRTTLEVDPLGNATRSSWDDDNNRVSTIDPRGGEFLREYDGDGNLRSETNPRGEITRWTYEPVFNQVETITDANNHTVTYGYDGSGNVTSRSEVVSGQLKEESFDYDSFGQMTEHTNARNLTTTYDWDPVKGSLESFTDALEQTTVVTTDSIGRVVTLTEPGQGPVQFELDEKSRLTSVIDPLGNETSMIYDAAGRQTEVATSRGTATMDFDALGRLVSTTNAAGDTTTTSYDAAGNVVATTDARGNSTTMSYDAIGRLIAMVDPLGHTWTYGTCAELGTGGQSTCTGNDCPSGGNADLGYCSLIDPQGNVNLQEHDELGRVIKRTDPLGNSTEIIYDAVGRRTGQRDALQRLTLFEYDERGLVTAVVEANGARTEYSYDLNGNLTNVKDAELRDWPRTYDELDRLKTESDPLGNTTTYTYDVFGNLETKLTPNGDLLTYEHDLGRLTAINLPGGATESFAYDTQGRVIAMSNAEVSLSYVYDELDRLTSLTNNTLTQTVTNEYDTAGNLIRMVGPNGPVSYSYDARNRLVQQVDPSTGTFRYEYDELGRRTALRYPNGLSTEYDYDAAGRLLSVLTRDASGLAADGYVYTYDEVGNRTRMALLHDSVVHDYEYDDNHRLTRWDRGPDRFEAYEYDDVGNRLTMEDQSGTITYSYDLADRLASEVRAFAGGGGETTTYTWDFNGNLTSKTAGAAVTTYDWDPLNRMTRLEDVSGVRTYGYDPRGMRVRESEGADVRRFLAAGDDLLATFDGLGAQTAYYAHGPDIDEPLAQQTLAQGTAYLHHDGLGSLTAFSQADGQLSGARAYAAFGGVEASSGVASRFGYTGRELDSSGLMYYRARYYQPDVGRFTSRDPLAAVAGDVANLNGFVYGFNNPIRYTDPSGLTPKIIDAIPAGILALFLLLFLELMVVHFVITLGHCLWDADNLYNCLTNFLGSLWSVSGPIVVVAAIVGFMTGMVGSTLLYLDGTLSKSGLFLIWLVTGMSTALVVTLGFRWARWIGSDKAYGFLFFMLTALIAQVTDIVVLMIQRAFDPRRP